MVKKLVGKNWGNGRLEKTNSYKMRKPSMHQLLGFLLR